MSSHDATLEFDYETPSRARLVADSVTREIGEIDDERSRTTIDREGASVRIEIDAADVIALRAALNTWVTLIDVAERTAEAGDATLEF
ncbi:KEOPS complex subunit Pcc1 [Natronolimnohabitans innermongolicus]|uniref:KEOPS complex Pcc1-like subunit n=1 Tax=Natronolimnohabitans innermongolicus JCM 12255 TaxID=1227499 RepID=L9XIN1_9EURY|nr:KEOPS complex subunit Pcc1 [Natronolimnohabitans innermongolicus]ELY61599.1 KEOPS complex Pcc1-like subunit [Natronolimnohabitans innermongolicus JCM 12255]